MGRVAAVGAGVDRFRIGERVGIPWLGHTCGECSYCRSGHENLRDVPAFTGYPLGIEEQRVRVILNLHEPPPAAERLGHEFRVFVKINVYEAQEALRVPISALFRRGEQWAVFTVERGRARIALVEIGHRNSTFAEVLRDLPRNATVVVHPNDRIVEGVRVVRIR